MLKNNPRFLLINPWIYDFAAYDFWAKPIGLLKIASLLMDNGIDVDFIDCLETAGFNNFPPILKLRRKKLPAAGLYPKKGSINLFNLKMFPVIIQGTE